MKRLTIKNALKTLFVTALTGTMLIQAVPAAANAEEKIVITGTTDYGLTGKTDVKIEYNTDYNEKYEKLEITGTAGVSGASVNYKVDASRDQITAEIPGSDKKISYDLSNRNSKSEGYIEVDTIKLVNGFFDHMKDEDDSKTYTIETNVTKKLCSSVEEKILSSKLPTGKTVKEFADGLMKANDKQPISEGIRNYVNGLQNKNEVTIEMNKSVPKKFVFGEGDKKFVAEMTGPEEGPWDVTVKCGDKELFKGKAERVKE